MAWYGTLTRYALRSGVSDPEEIARIERLGWRVPSGVTVVGPSTPLSDEERSIMDPGRGSWADRIAKGLSGLSDIMRSERRDDDDRAAVSGFRASQGRGPGIRWYQGGIAERAQLDRDEREVGGLEGVGRFVGTLARLAATYGAGAAAGGAGGSGAGSAVSGGGGGAMVGGTGGASSWLGQFGMDRSGMAQRAVGMGLSNAGLRSKSDAQYEALSTLLGTGARRRLGRQWLYEEPDWMVF